MVKASSDLMQIPSETEGHVIERFDAAGGRAWVKIFRCRKS